MSVSLPSGAELSPSSAAARESIGAEWILLTPVFHTDAPAWDLFVDFVLELGHQPGDPDLLDPNALRALRERATRRARQELTPRYQPVCVAISILCDLVAHGWTVRAVDRQVQIRRPDVHSDRHAERQRVRRGLTVARDEQLSERSIREFVTGMTVRRPGPKGWCSIHSLMRDGPELAATLREADSHRSPEGRAASLGRAIDPYIQFVTEDARCDWTGLRLAEIWRYFRYTWLTPARSTPGRNMMILVRDAAVEPHPVIGIAQLSSSIVQQSDRDRWIGWDRESATAQVKREPTEERAAWLLRLLVELTEGVYTEDFISQGVLTLADLDRPSQPVLERLAELGSEERQRHQREVRKRAYKQKQAVDEWQTVVRSPLYRSKRALMLADLLEIRRSFLAAGLERPEAEQLQQACNDRSFLKAVGSLVRYAKAARVGINMMDISVAGCIAPYNPLLGGKLVSLLLTSPEVGKTYAQRYGETPSVIASGMKGAAVPRRPDLVLLCTTGLFGGGSSQYNRIRMPARRAGGEHGEIRFLHLAETRSYGTFHFSQATLAEMKRYAKQRMEETEVNGIFGEGVNPKMRKIRQELLRLGFPQDALLQTGSPRSVYVIPLAHNFREVLLGQTTEPDWILRSVDPPSTSKCMAEYWRERWLSERIRKPGVLESVEGHARTFPIHHGAAVTLPSLEDEDQLAFEDVSYELDDISMDK